MNKAEAIANQYATLSVRTRKLNVLEVLPAKEWMDRGSKMAKPKMLFGPLWFTGELTVLFAGTGVGKTVLAVYIADLISSGKQWLPFPNECGPQKVLYIDFELSNKQFQIRYTNPDTGEMHAFNENFLRAELNSEEEISDEDIMRAIEEKVVQTGATVLVVDNITWLGNEMEKGRNAKALMRILSDLKKNHKLSILVLAHTPKRDETLPIELNDLYGSVMIANFIDGAFTLGRSKRGIDYRYIKQLKCRSAITHFHENNVAFIEIGKWNNRMAFTFNDFSTEREHLRGVDSTKQDLMERLQHLHEQGLNQRQIAKELGKSLGFVNENLKKLNG
jgi:RecA-family ATPase